MSGLQGLFVGSSRRCLFFSSINLGGIHQHPSGTKHFILYEYLNNDVLGKAKSARGREPPIFGMKLDSCGLFTDAGRQRDIKVVVPCGD